MTLPPRVVVTAAQGSIPPPNISAYLLSCLAQPDAGSEFAERLAQSGLMRLPEQQRISALMSAGYIALLFPQEDDMVGHAFLQRHGSELHLFSLAVSKPHRGQDLGWGIVLELLAFAREAGGIQRIRLSRGAHGYFAEYVLPRVAGEQHRLSVSVDCDTGFVTLT